MNVRTRRLYLLASFLLGFAFLGAMASSPAAAQQGTPEQRAACENDAMQVCGQYVPDVVLITACMKRNCRNLSARCRAAMHCAKRRGR